MRKINIGKARVTSIGAVSLLIAGVTGATTFKPMFTELDTFKIGVHSINVGASASGSATVIALVRGVTPIVRFTSSNPAVATVPPLRDASTGTATVAVTGASAGCAKISASFNGKTRSDDIVVHAASSGASFSMTVPDDNLVWPLANKASLNMRMQGTGLSAPGTETTITLKPVTWTLTSSNTAVAKVPASVTQTSSATPFTITGVGDGCAIITATTGTQRVSKTVRVVYIGG
jgi:hypothetical protein